MNDESRSKSGIPGLDEVLFGGLIAQQVYSAHELRNPLAPIRTAAHVLASRRFPPPQKIQWAQSVIQHQVGHMALLLDDLPARYRTYYARQARAEKKTASH